MVNIGSLHWRSLIITIGIVIGLLSLSYLVISSGDNLFRPTIGVQIGSGKFNVWVANTEPQLIQGLSGVSRLPTNGGLFMDFKTDDTWGIWMKDMRIPIDIVWLDKDKKVVYIIQNAQPETPVKTVYRPPQPARYVLELPAGSVKQVAIKTGITVKISDNK